MNLNCVDLISIYRNWKRNLGPFEGFMRSGPFVSLQTYENFEINVAVNEEQSYNKHKDTLNQIIKCDLKKDFLIFDISMKDSLEIAYILNNKFNIKPIINFNFLFHPFGFVGDKEDIEALIKYGSNLVNMQPRGYVLFLDYGRYLDFPKELYKQKLNNQYELTEEDLPKIETLKELGYSKVKLFTINEPKEDISNYMKYIKVVLDSEIIKGV